MRGGVAPRDRHRPDDAGHERPGICRSARRTDRENRDHFLSPGEASIDTAVQAIKLGAYDYLAQTARAQRLRDVLTKGLKQISLAREAGALRQRLESPLGSYGALIGKSAPMRRLYQQIGQIAPTDAAVQVSGESGTGKELVAQTLHDLSARREGNSLALNCAAISPTLMESELFGHEKAHSPAPSTATWVALNKPTAARFC